MLETRAGHDAPPERQKKKGNRLHPIALPNPSNLLAVTICDLPRQLIAAQ